MKKLDELNKKVVYDPLTGGTQTIYWDDEGTQFVSIPNNVIPYKIPIHPFNYKWTDNEDGSKTWELLND